MNFPIMYFFPGIKNFFFFWGGGGGGEAAF
eukprot:COSAG06_NODE_7613_length_2439_cov_5.166239_4_plen_29_part_01